jgi:hypothetical protein
MIVGDTHDQAALALHQVAPWSDLLTSHCRRPAWKRSKDGQGNGLVHAKLPIESLGAPKARLWRGHNNPMTRRAARPPRKRQEKPSCIKPLEHNRRIGAAETE